MRTILLQRFRPALVTLLMLHGMPEMGLPEATRLPSELRRLKPCQRQQEVK